MIVPNKEGQLPMEYWSIGAGPHFVPLNGAARGGARESYNAEADIHGLTFRDDHFLKLIALALRQHLLILAVCLLRILTSALLHLHSREGKTPTPTPPYSFV